MSESLEDKNMSPVDAIPAAEPWACIKGGRWHRTTNLAVNFTDTITSLCGLSFRPFNVSDGFPSYTRRDLWAYPRCEAIHAQSQRAGPRAA